jgi:N-acetyl-D-muramate 6-phosphate phosphatase
VVSPTNAPTAGRSRNLPAEDGRRKTEAVFFDLDGTLLDTAPDMVNAINAVRVEQSLDPLPFALVRDQVSHGAVAVVRTAFPHAPEADFLALRDRFLALYRRRLADETRPFPGIVQLLDALERERIAWGVVTNKPAWLAEPLLEALGLRHRATTVVSGDTLPERKPHPRPLLLAAERAQAAPQNCIYVGDAERDVVAGKAAGMRTLVACFGYIGPMDDARAWPADGWIDSPLEVLPWLANDEGSAR